MLSANKYHLTNCTLDFRGEQNNSLDNTKLKALLRQVREEVGLKQSELAERLATRQAWVSSYERGERRLDVLELRQVLTALGLDFVDFMVRLDAVLRSSDPPAGPG